MLEDPELARDFADKRNDALARAYRSYAPALYSTALGVLRDSRDAQDCVHDAILRVWERPAAYAPERGSLKGFLVVCVRNEALQRLRNSARRLAILKETAGSEADARYEIDIPDHIASERLRAALAKLPNEQRTALELAYFARLTHVQIAERLDVPIGTIKTRLATGLRKLQQAMPAETVTPL